MLCGESAALRSSAAGSFRVFAPLPPQAPSEEQSPSTPRYAYGVFIPGRYSGTPPPGRIPPEVCRAPRGQAFRLLAQTLSVWSTAAPFPKPPKTAPVGQCLGFALERNTFDSAGEPSRLRPRRESAHPQRRSLSGSGSLRSPSPCTAKARRIPTLPDTLRGHAPLASLVPRPMALADSQPPHKATAATLASVRLPAP